MRRLLMLWAAGLSVLALSTTANAGVQATPFRASLDSVAQTAATSHAQPALETLAQCRGGGYGYGHSGYSRSYYRPSYSGVSVSYGRPSYGYGGYGGGYGGGGGYGRSYYGGGHHHGHSGYSNHYRRGSGIGLYIGF